ncbi:ribosome small subunit-dependent GTPase A [Maridesulfovibrio zosterae]|uniref:ribosome small subunit-dependent GTPase A n=1 Tax=Maridesulfovibrio zosterae TaxID=82171 RepID=UPI000408F5D0|nr:ribosome small subunit-dependent GTPase A [Maridesulfovibrio zosterae]
MSNKQYSLEELGWKKTFKDQLSTKEEEIFLPARVTMTHKGHVVVSTGDSEHLLKIAEKGIGSLNQQPTVGDWLLLDKNSIVPERLLERTSLLQRMAPGQEVKLQPIAANIDTLFIVSSCNSEFNLNRIERYICLALEAGVNFVLVLTKEDLTEEAQKYRKKAKKLFEDIETITINGKDHESVQKLHKWFEKGETVVLLGSSGVGKTTLLNTINGTTKEKTGSIRESDEKGRHTTTTRSLHVMPSGALLIDVPGIRELQLHDCQAGINRAFAEIVEAEDMCRFSDCSHQQEPGCAVRDALEQGTLDQRRLDNYLKLKEEAEKNTDNIAEKQKRKSGKKNKYSRKWKK